MITQENILETIRMIHEECLDIRTITMEISLLDCADTDIDRSCEKIYKKITSRAGKLVETAQAISRQYGIPIINERVAVTPIALSAERIRRRLRQVCEDPGPGGQGHRHQLCRRLYGSGPEGHDQGRP
jgi:uncharacterized protein (UPF0210 family)